MSGTYPASPKPAHITASWTAPTLFSVTHGGRVQTRQRLGHRWSWTLTYKPGMTRAEAAALLAFLINQDGRAEKFFWKWPDYAIRGAASFGGVTNGVTAIGATSIVTDGWGLSVTGLFLAGDIIRPLGGYERIYMVTADVNSDGAGNATIPVKPAVNESIADGTTIEISSPTAGVMLASDTIQFDIDRCLFHGLTVELTEANP